MLATKWTIHRALFGAYLYGASQWCIWHNERSTLICVLNLIPLVIGQCCKVLFEDYFFLIFLVSSDGAEENLCRCWIFNDLVVITELC